MIRRIFAALLFSACAFIACSREVTIGGKCNITEDCHSDFNNIPDTVCIDGYCTCTTPGYDHCCFRDNIENCSKEDPYRCRPQEECDPMAPFIFPDAGADASDGG